MECNMIIQIQIIPRNMKTVKVCIIVFFTLVFVYAQVKGIHTYIYIHRVHCGIILR